MSSCGTGLCPFSSIQEGSHELWFRVQSWRSEGVVLRSSATLFRPGGSHILHQIQQSFHTHLTTLEAADGLRQTADMKQISGKP